MRTMYSTIMVLFICLACTVISCAYRGGLHGGLALNCQQVAIRGKKGQLKEPFVKRALLDLDVTGIHAEIELWVTSVLFKGFTNTSGRRVALSEKQLFNN